MTTVDGPGRLAVSGQGRGGIDGVSPVTGHRSARERAAGPA